MSQPLPDSKCAVSLATSSLSRATVTLRRANCVCSLQTAFVNHCIGECGAYRSLNLITHCYPCNLNCMDHNAFVEHVIHSESCPAHTYLTSRGKRNGGRSFNGKKAATRPETIQLD